MPVIEGVDYAWGAPDPAGLVAAGKKFAVRYGGPGSDGKQLHAAELAQLRAHGLDVVANAEGAAGGFRGGANGKSWAQQAKDHFGALGMPAGRPIYFSVDWDATSADWPDIDAALSGAASVIGRAQVGVYGGYKTVNHCASVGVSWLWQTYAWSGGQWHPAVQMQQYRNGVTVAGGDCDLDRAMVADYGQWGYKNTTEDDVSEADVTAALTKFFGSVPGGAANYFGWYPTSNADGMKESVIGDRALKQPVPNPLRATTDANGVTITPRTLAYQLLVDIASMVGATPSAEENAAAVVKALGGADGDLRVAAGALRNVLSPSQVAELIGYLSTP